MMCANRHVFTVVLTKKVLACQNRVLVLSCWSMEILYVSEIDLPEINAIENIWREKINECIVQNRRQCAACMTKHTNLPVEIWEYIYEFVMISVPLVHDVTRTCYESKSHLELQMKGISSYQCMAL